MPDVLITEFMDEAIAREALAGLDLVYAPELVEDRAALLAAAAGARALIVRNRTRVDGELLEHAPALTAVGRLGVGLDNIDLTACEARGVQVYPATGANDVAVAEYVIAAVLMLLRGIYTQSARIAAGVWPRTEMMGRETAGKCLGLIGFGAIARQVAARGAALGMRAVAHDPYLDAGDPAWSEAESRPLAALAAEADVVSLHVPLTDDTRGLVDRRFIEAMRDGAILVNTARGGIVDEDAVVTALRAGRLGGAALDVFETEPVLEAAGRRFQGVPNLILTPHVAGVTVESNLRVSRVTAEAIAGHLRGTDS